MSTHLEFAGPRHRDAVALAAAGDLVHHRGHRPGSAAPPSCGVSLYPSLDPSGEFACGEILDLTEDGVYVGSSQDAAGIERATYWVDGVAHAVPVDLEDGDLLDVTEGHLAVGDGYDPTADRDRGYVFDIDTGEVTWLPGIGGDWASARRINEHGVAVGDGGAANGTGHPLRWRPPYTRRRAAARSSAAARGAPAPGRPATTTTATSSGRPSAGG